MQRILKSSVKLFCLPPRHFSITSTTFSWNPIKYSQNLDLGQQVFRVHAINSLIDTFPALSAAEVNDLVSGLTHENHIFWKLKDLSQLKATENSHDILAKLGELKRRNDDSGLNEILNEFNEKCLYSLTSEDTIMLIKSQHPKFLLRHFCTSENINLTASTLLENNKYYLTSIYFDEGLVATAKHERAEEAERLACLSTLKMRFLEQFNDISLEDFEEIPLEGDVDIGKEHRQRVVNIVKSPEQSYGFTIRGGQQKVVKNEEYVQLNIVTPILISDVKEGSPAEEAGLRKGDVVHGINDHALTNKTHQQAVVILKKFAHHEELSLTVQYNKHESLKYQVEQNILEREWLKVSDEVKSKNFKKWHESKSKVDPKEYYMERFVEKKRKYQPKMGGNTNRLWHQYKK